MHVEQEKAQTFKILIVDDNPDNIDVLVNALENVGYNLAIATSGEKALKTTTHFLPDLILLDLMMPGMDGLAILQKLQANPKTQQIPIIILTAKAQSHEQEYFGQLKVLSVIAKPYDPMTISDQIFSVLA